MIIDVVLGLVLVGYAVSGYRQGLVVSLLSLTGFLGGGALALWGLPRLIDRYLTPGTGDVRQLIAVVIGVLAAATIGQAVGATLGRDARRSLRTRPLRAVDSALGAASGVVAVCLLVGVVAAALRTGPSAVVSRGVASSRIVQSIDAVAPIGSDRVFEGFRRLLDVEGAPRVFAGLGPERIRDVPAPDGSALVTAAVRRAGRSVVKVTGLAASCGRSQEGSGWVVASQRVVTNAHVVAGVEEPEVSVGGVGRRYPGRVVVFDPRRDLAVIAVPGLPAPAVPLGSDLEPDDTAVVAGFPLDGPYRLDAARVRDVLSARGEDIYGDQRSVREVYSLFARVQPGNSGGPLLSAQGRVVGVVFAKSLDDDSTGYALTLDESRPVLEAAAGATRTVPVGACASD